MAETGADASEQDRRSRKSQPRRTHRSQAAHFAILPRPQAAAARIRQETGVDVEFIWFEYVPSMEAFAAGRVDAVCMTNGDALVTGATGKPSVGILINDYSNGNDMIVAAPGIESMKDLKGKKVGIEEGFVEHLLLLTGLEKNGLKPEDK